MIRRTKTYEKLILNMGSNFKIKLLPEILFIIQKYVSKRAHNET